MPSKVKLFGRRRSSGNALDIAPEAAEPAPAQSSFRVLERPDKTAHSFDSPHGGTPKRVSQIRPFNSPLQQFRGKSSDNLALGQSRWVPESNHLGPSSALKRDRGSGGTTNSGSSGYYDSSSASARHSSSSTLPSSLDQEREPDEDELFPRKAATTSMLHAISADNDEPLPPPPSFSARAARAFSFGQKHNRTESIPKDIPIPQPISHGTPRSAPRSPERSHSPQRDRSMTTSSYASTAKPIVPEPNLSLGNASFGDDFGNMFSKIGKGAESPPLQSPPPVGGFHRTVGAGKAEPREPTNKPQESEPMYPPRSYSRQALTPSPNATRTIGADGNSPYEWDERTSQDGMLSGSALSSPRFDEGPPPPAHGNGIPPAFLGKSKAGYALVPERGPSPALERMSSDSYTSDSGNEKEQLYNNRQPQLDDPNPWVKRVELRDSQPQALSNSASNTSFKTAASTVASPVRPQHAQTQANAGALRAGAISPTSQDGELFGESSNTTPKAVRLVVPGFQDEPLHDSSPSGPPSRAIRPGSNHTRTESGTPKRMTKAQFEMLQRIGDGASVHSAEDAHQHDDDDYDDEDDAERVKQATKQRRKQEATMSVYRQQMKKVAGGGPGDLPPMTRPSMDRASNSAPAGTMSGLHFGGISGTPPAETVRGKDTDEDDDDVPLGILQAHGFPSAARPPTRAGEGDAQMRMSVAGSVANGGAGQGNLPPFARRLPADPYFGASLVNQANRESLAFSSAQSVYGGPPAMPQMHAQSPMGQPGGLVGVIAGEERARAARRGSPNPATGQFNPMPLPANMNVQPQMPPMPRTMSMGSIAAPNVYTPSGYMPGMPPMPQMPMMMMPPQDQSSQQMQQFMQMQMQVMQNMLAMQQQQLGQTPPPQQPTTDYLGVPIGANRPMSMASQAPSFAGGANQGRAMTMMTPPPGWGDFNNMGQQRPTSAMPGKYAPSVQGLNLSAGGPGPGYTPSIAPSERSNIGMPSRYRPVATNGEAPNGRSQSMTSSMTLQAFTNQQSAPAIPRPDSQPIQQTRNTIRIVDKPKGTPKVSARPVGADEDEDEGWADMAKKRTERKFGWRRKETKNEPALSDLYSNLE